MLSNSCVHRIYARVSRKSEKAMAPHSSTLAWKIPWMGEPGGLPSMGSHRVGHDQSDLAAAAASRKLPVFFLFISGFTNMNVVTE